MTFLRKVHCRLWGRARLLVIWVRISSEQAGVTGAGPSLSWSLLGCIFPGGFGQKEKVKIWAQSRAMGNFVKRGLQASNDPNPQQGIQC